MMESITHAIEGAGRWLTCPRVDAAEAERRAAVCRSCVHLTYAGLPLSHYAAGYCGRPIIGGPEGTCGCVVLRAKKQDRADGCAVGEPWGKTTCAGEVCPLSRW